MLILREIGRDRADHALNSGVVRWLKAGKRTSAVLAVQNLVDVLRRDLGLDDERVALGHDQHSVSPAADHAADGVHGELMHDARSAARGSRCA